MQQNLNQDLFGLSAISSRGVVLNFPKPNCNLPGTYHSSLSGSGGFFSNFQVYFSSTGIGISSASVYVVGMPIGWSWTSTVSTFNGSGYTGCVGGTITNGLQIGNITIGWIQNYHFKFYFNPELCSLSYSQGSGRCR